MTVDASVVAPVSAVLAATMIGASGVAQRRAALAAPSFAAGDPRLLRTLARARWWWIGTAAAVAGLCLQVLALATGPLLLVQGLLIGSVVATTACERLLLGRRPTRWVLAGVALTLLGLVGMLTALAPTGGGGTGPSGPEVLTLAGACAAVMVATVVWARRSPRRAWAVAACTGVGYGVVAVLLKQVGLQLAGGLTAPFAHPALYATVALGAWSVLLSQNALQQGCGAVAVVTPILVLDPLVGLVAGLVWFGERVASTPDVLGVAVGCTVLLVLGMGLVEAAGRSAQRTTTRVATPARR
ncbi:DMT family transporter [Pseudonocardia endophytica]|uniref:Magnesium transporter NIPA n=1 Tax=Pseudonocardia endophytica TaxID=401976 RepID=A0A4R1I3B0_PSEEN|nr:DMT family transporter [Pseudonocardia endophytica]TCK24462.1 hypothetical protein EV378_0234 [Pseudonocardia endophytica]